jgi:hypothetical protein
MDQTLLVIKNIFLFTVLSYMVSIFTEAAIEPKHYKNKGI